MKIRKIIGTSMVLALALIVSGCKGKVDDVQKQIKSAKTFVDSEEFKTAKDYSYSAYMFAMDTPKEIIEISIKRDDENIHLSLKLGTEVEIHVWAGYQGDEYRAFYDDGEIREYGNISKVQLDFIFGELGIFSNHNLGGIGLETSLSSALSKGIDNAKEQADSCKNDGVTCTVEKDMLGKKVKFIVTNENEKNEWNFYKGKLISNVRNYKLDEKDVQTSYTIDYDDQSIILPNVSNFLYNENIMDRFN